MKKKVLIFVGILAAVVLIFTAGFLIKISHGSVTTSEPIRVYSVNIKYDGSPVAEKLSPIVIKNVLVINGKENQLIISFQDQEKAMEAVKKRNPEFLQLMKKKWNLDDLNFSNWKVYKQNLVQYTATKLPDDLGGDKYESQRQEVEIFFTICEDEEINQETLKYAGFVNFLFKTGLVHRVTLDPIVGNFPMSAPIVQEWDPGK